MCTGAASYSISYKEKLWMTAGEGRDKIKQELKKPAAACWRVEGGN
jgi:hypothetical protein